MGWINLVCQHKHANVIRQILGKGRCVLLRVSLASMWAKCGLCKFGGTRGPFHLGGPHALPFLVLGARLGGVSLTHNNSRTISPNCQNFYIFLVLPPSTQFNVLDVMLSNESFNFPDASRS